MPTTSEAAVTTAASPSDRTARSRVRRRQTSSTTSARPSEKACTPRYQRGSAVSSAASAAGITTRGETGSPLERRTRLRRRGPVARVAGAVTG